MIVALSIIFFLLCLFLVFIVVIQPAHGEGLASAFGGGGSESFFGSKAGQHMNRFTIVLAVLFLVLALAINMMNRSKSKTPGDSNPPSPAPMQPNR